MQHGLITCSTTYQLVSQAFPFSDVASGVAVFLFICLEALGLELDNAGSLSFYARHIRIPRGIQGL